MNERWPFADPPNVAVFTSKQIISGNAWIHYVSHDEDDGAWQFHPVGFTTEEDAAVVGLGTIVRLDPALRELHDLPFGWVATREGPGEAWGRRRAEP